MPRFFVLVRLREGRDAQEYEEWAATRDAPSVRALPSIERFNVVRIDGALGGDPPYQYVEVIDVVDMDRFRDDVASPTMQEVAAEFNDWAEPTFIYGEEIV